MPFPKPDHLEFFRSIFISILTMLGAALKRCATQNQMVARVKLYLPVLFRRGGATGLCLPLWISRRRPAFRLFGLGGDVQSLYLGARCSRFLHARELRQLLFQFQHGLEQIAPFFHARQNLRGLEYQDPGVLLL